jgi:hypothetical protein
LAIILLLDEKGGHSTEGRTREGHDSSFNKPSDERHVNGGGGPKILIFIKREGAIALRDEGHLILGAEKA